MKKTLLLIIPLLLILSPLFTQKIPNRPNLYYGFNSEMILSFNYRDSCSVCDIKILGNNIWLATGNGAEHSNNFGDTWTYYDSSDGIGSGGVSGLSVRNIADSTNIVWLATAFVDSQYQVPTGSGISYTVNNGINWTYLSQPIDDPNETTIIYFGQAIPALPITVTANNVTYDIAQIDSLVFIASWAGGLRKSIDNGNTWQRVLLPTDEMTYLDISNASEVEMLNPQDPPYGNHNHKAFSVIAYEENNNIMVWCGTANGINKSEDGGLTWIHYNHQTSWITGDFVVALHRQIKSGVSIVWAATLNAESQSEQRGISFTMDNGITWETALIGERPYNISSFGHTTFISTSEGLYKTWDDINWEWFEETEGLDVYATQKDYMDRLWIGTSEGLLEVEDTTNALWNEINFGSEPYILSVLAPNTMVLPPADHYLSDTIYVEVDDPDSIEDISDVWFLSLKPDGEYANDGNPIFLQDDGNGMFSFPLFLSYDTQPGIYEWTFNARDLSGNISEPFIHYCEIIDSTLSINEELYLSPFYFSLHQNYPNPFNPITSLRYDLPEQAQVILTVYDLMGREVTQLVKTTQEAGFKSVQWNATDMHGKPVSAGVYLYQIRAGEFVQTKKMVLLK